VYSGSAPGVAFIGLAVGFSSLAFLHEVEMLRTAIAKITAVYQISLLMEKPFSN
jgi:hypothetical protein